MNTNVRALAVCGNDFYGGGQFTAAGGRTVGFVARAYLGVAKWLDLEGLLREPPLA